MAVSSFDSSLSEVMRAWKRGRDSPSRTTVRASIPRSTSVRANWLWEDLSSPPGVTGLPDLAPLACEVPFCFSDVMRIFGLMLLRGGREIG